MENPEADTTWSEIDKRFGTRLVKASDALRCCRAGVSRGAGQMGLYMLELLRSVTDSGKWGDEGLGVVGRTTPSAPIELAPGRLVIPVPSFDVRGVGPGAAGLVLVGLAMLEMLREQDGAWTLAQTAADAVPTLVNRARRSQEPDCVKCVASSLLPQTAPRKYETVKIRRRV